MDPKKIVEEGYDRVADRHHEWTQTVRVEERAAYTTLLLEALPPGARVLDLGCGAGVPTTRELARKFIVTGVDISAEQITLAREHVPEASFVQGDITQIHLPGESFDGVAAFYSIIHVPRDEQPGLLRNIAGWLRPGGLLVMAMSTQPGEGSVDEDFLGAPMYWSGFDAETNCRMVEKAGFDIVQAREETAYEFGEAIIFLWVVARVPGAQTRGISDE